MLRLRNEQLDLTLLLGIARERVERHEKLATSRARLPSRRERLRPRAPGHTSECVCGKGPPPTDRARHQWSGGGSGGQRRSGQHWPRPTLRSGAARPRSAPVGRVIATATVLETLLASPDGPPRDGWGVYENILLSPRHGTCHVRPTCLAVYRGGPGC